MGQVISHQFRRDPVRALFVDEESAQQAADKIELEDGVFRASVTSYYLRSKLVGYHVTIHSHPDAIRRSMTVADVERLMG